MRDESIDGAPLLDLVPELAPYALSLTIGGVPLFDEKRRVRSPKELRRLIKAKEAAEAEARAASEKGADAKVLQFSAPERR